MTWKKRLRMLVAVFTQRWHEQTCCECGFTWMAEGRAHPELIRTCDRCELENMDRFWDFAEQEYQRVMKGAER